MTRAGFQVANTTRDKAIQPRPALMPSTHMGVSAVDRYAPPTPLQARSADVTDRLARQKDTMLAQFQAMEDAIGKIQAQGTQMTAMLTGLPMERTKFELGDTYLPPGGVSGGST